MASRAFMNLDGKRIVVIGGTGGLGREIGLRIAALGADVAFSYRSNASAAKEVASEIGELGGRAFSESLDLADFENVGAFLQRAHGALGAVDAVIHTAGADIRLDYVSDASTADFAEAINADLGGFFHVVKAALPYLRETRGALVALTSAGVARHPPRDILSTAPKAGMEALIRAVAREEGRYGVRANGIGVGSVQAGLWHRLAERAPPGFMDAAAANTALRRHGSAREIADVAAFLTSDASSFVTGHILVADGGFSI